LGRNTFTGPGFANVNTRISKAFHLRRLGENTTLEFSCDLFNIFNRVNLGNVSGTLSSTTFGKAITSEGARQVMFGIRINF